MNLAENIIENADLLYAQCYITFEGLPLLRDIKLIARKLQKYEALVDFIKENVNFKENELPTILWVEEFKKLVEECK
jgi:hypothetical protein